MTLTITLGGILWKQQSVMNIQPHQPKIQFQGLITARVLTAEKVYLQ